VLRKTLTDLVRDKSGEWKIVAFGTTLGLPEAPCVTEREVRGQPGLEQMLYLEQAVTRIEWGEGLALRYGGFYGPGTSVSLAPDAQMAAPIRKRRFPIVGDGGGVFSYIHIRCARAL